MSKLQRITGKTFGETATATGDDPQIGQFGSALLGTYNGTTDVATIQRLSAWSNGFIDAVTPTNQYPPLPEMTGALKVLSYQENYILQQGMPEWDSATDYHINGYCSYNGTIYKSLIDDNVGNQPDLYPTAWTVYGAIDDYANQSLTNLTGLGNARLQYNPFSVNDGTVVLGNNNTLTSGSFTKYYSDPGVYTLTITEAGNYEVEMYGGGGSWSVYTVNSATRENTGGSGAGYKGVITLTVGNYTVTVGAGYNRNNLDGGDTSLGNLIITGGGKKGAHSMSAAPGAGGVVTIDASATIVSTTFSRNGNAGQTAYVAGNAWPQLYGSVSVYDNTYTGYGAGGGYLNNGVNGYFKIRKVSGDAAKIFCDPCVITTANMKTFVDYDGHEIDVSDKTDGDYYIFKDFTDGSISLVSNFVALKTAPATPSEGDYWLDISTVLPNLNIYDSSNWSINNDLVCIGKCTVESGAASAVKNNQFNMNGYYELFNLPDYSAKISISSGVSYTAEENGWIITDAQVIKPIYVGESYTAPSSGYYFAPMKGY